MSADDVFLTLDAVRRLTRDVARSYDHAYMAYTPFEQNWSRRKNLRELRFMASESEWYLDLLTELVPEVERHLPGVDGPLRSAAQVLRLAGELAETVLSQFESDRDEHNLRAVAHECETHFEIARNRMQSASEMGQRVSDAQPA